MRKDKKFHNRKIMKIYIFNKKVEKNSKTNNK